MVKAQVTFRVRPSLPEELQPLLDLAMNLRWAWDPATYELFQWADKRAWAEVGGNPVALLGRLTRKRLAELAADSAFGDRVAAVAADLARYLTGKRWAQDQEPPPPPVAYFSPEFGITEAMQTYSGGLGVLAGDHLKAASDLGLDLVGVGLLYRHGYFRQQLDADGWQQERYPDLNPNSLPLVQLERSGQPLTVSVTIGEREVAAQIWHAQVGRIPVLLLDTDVAVNHPDDRVITDRLYGGDAQHRLRQELILGIGGMRALDVAREVGVVGFEPQVFHSNEGHAGFLQIERIRRLVAEGLDFDAAVATAKLRCVFTTHTPVPAGIDRFPNDLMERYFTTLAAECGVTLEQLLALGREPHDTSGTGAFNMAMLGLRLSAVANGVSQLHGVVSREMFSALWPGVDQPEVPITAVTNGVHAPTWVGPEMRAVYDRALRRDWADSPDAWGDLVDGISDDMLWRARGRARERMVQRLRSWVGMQRARRGEPVGARSWVQEIFDPDALTIGFARRFAEYKRGTLLLSHPDRLRRLLLSTDRPVQIVFAGKAHPRDDIGKGLIREIVHFSAEAELRTRIVFAEDYDIELARVLLQGVDLWLNTPRRPHEACGTSGEKAVLNGALHCSTLDGWWDELYDGHNGFVIGTADRFADTGQQDAADAASLFDTLERSVVPLFYERTDAPLPRRWIEMVRHSIATLGPEVLATRMVREYAEKLYVPVADRAQRLSARGGKGISALAAWRAGIAEHWDDVRIREVYVAQEVADIGEERSVRVVAHLGKLDPGDVAVQVVHGEVAADGQITEPQVADLQLDGDAPDGATAWSGAIAAQASGEYGVAARVVPAHHDLLSWTETGLVTWADATAS